MTQDRERYGVPAHLGIRNQEAKALLSFFTIRHSGAIFFLGAIYDRARDAGSPSSLDHLDSNSSVRHAQSSNNDDTTCRLILVSTVQLRRGVLGIAKTVWK